MIRLARCFSLSCFGRKRSSHLEGGGLYFIRRVETVMLDAAAMKVLCPWSPLRGSFVRMTRHLGGPLLGESVALEIPHSQIVELRWSITRSRDLLFTKETVYEMDIVIPQDSIKPTRN